MEIARKLGSWINGYKSARKLVNTDLKGLFDGDYETAAERQYNRATTGSKYTLRPVAMTGMGIQFRLGKRVSFGTFSFGIILISFGNSIFKLVCL